MNRYSNYISIIFGFISNEFSYTCQCIHDKEEFTWHVFVVICNLQTVSTRLPRIHVHLINAITLVEHVTSRLSDLSVTADLDFTLRTNQSTSLRYLRFDYATSNVLTT